jgi:hypothetical protein
MSSHRPVAVAGSAALILLSCDSGGRVPGSLETIESPAAMKHALQEFIAIGDSTTRAIATLRANGIECVSSQQLSASARQILGDVHCGIEVSRYSRHWRVAIRDSARLVQNYRVGLVQFTRDSTIYSEMR